LGGKGEAWVPFVLVRQEDDSVGRWPTDWFCGAIDFSLAIDLRSTYHCATQPVGGETLGFISEIVASSSIVVVQFVRGRLSCLVQWEVMG